MHAWHMICTLHTRQAPHPTAAPTKPPIFTSQARQGECLGGFGAIGVLALCLKAVFPVCLVALHGNVGAVHGVEHHPCATGACQCDQADQRENLRLRLEIGGEVLEKRRRRGGDMRIYFITSDSRACKCERDHTVLWLTMVRGVGVCVGIYLEQSAESSH